MAARTARRAERRRLDLELVARGIAPSRERAQALILGGAVRVDGEPVRRPSALVAPDAEIASRTGPDYVGRGAEKLIGALDDFGITVTPFSRLDARLAASFYRHRSGLSLADRVCLALARSLSSPAYTTDRIWQNWADDLDVDVQVIR